MSKIMDVARREFLATIGTKGFIFGIVIVPVLLLISIGAFHYLFNENAPRVEGEIVVIDPTGAVGGILGAKLRPEAIAARREDFQDRLDEQMSKRMGTAAASGPVSEEARRRALETVMGEVPVLEVKQLPAGADLESAKAPLREGKDEPGLRLALVVFDADVLTPVAENRESGSYDLYLRPKLDDRIVDEIRSGVREALIDARSAHAGLDPKLIDSLTRMNPPRIMTVTEEGETEANQVATVLMPMGFMGLLFIAVMTGGQSLMTSTVEEKSSRVVEVLLSAVSPMQLMAGKILGQFAVGFLILAVYAAMGLIALAAFAMLGIIDLSLLFYLLIFYLIAHFVVASLLAAIGAAVNELREAQSLLSPVMLVLVIPWLLWMPISRSPNSAFSVIMSFLPPVNPFVMLIRMASTSPPPWWQVWLSIAIGAASIYGAVWCAAKIFRIGLLMYGKPPDFKTLIRWIRMA